MIRSNSSNPTTTPLLNPNSTTTTDNDHRSLRRQSLSEASRFLRRATTTRSTLSSPSITVRETAAQQIEDRQTDWAYSKPVVILDVFWNILFVAVAVTVLVLSKDEEPKPPLRLWVLGYALQCAAHVVCVCVEYRRRRRPVENEAIPYVRLAELTSSVVKNMESANTVFSFVWWIMGFYWVSPDGQELVQHSPKLYWLCVAFLAFDVFFVLVCIALACVIGIAVCCCLPCIIAVLYAVVDQEGATKEDIDQLLKYKFRRLDIEKPNGEILGPSGGVMTECGTDSPIEHVLAPEDAECCICLCSYDDGVELRELPCGHHFHCACIDKWLHINATCPLCKYNILKQSPSDLEAV